MTNVFLLDSDPRFRSLLPPETDTFVDVAKQFDGTPIGDPWTPFSVEYDPDSPHLPAGDFPGLLLPHIPVFSRRAAEALDGGRDPVEPVGVTVAQRHVGAERREPQGDALADAAGTAGDDGDAPLERDVRGGDHESSGRESMRMALPRTILWTVSSSSPSNISSAIFFVCGHVESVWG